MLERGLRRLPLAASDRPDTPRVSVISADVNLIAVRSCESVFFFSVVEEASCSGTGTCRECQPTHHRCETARKA